MTDEQSAGGNGQESNDGTNKLSASEREGVLEPAPNQGGNTGEWRPGDKLNSEYIIVKKLGSGGFGITYLATDSKGTQVAIKTIKKELQIIHNFDYQKFLKDIPKEALRMAACRHPHIVRVETTFHEECLPCIVMEYISGKTLQEWVNDQAEPMSEEEALKYIQQVGAALIYVHGLLPPILHRDVKPTNIIINTQESKAVLIDFGIARDLNPGDPFFTVLTTVGYAPIEQYYSNEPQGSYTDVYALAATLYFMLTGTAPADARNRVLQVARDREDILKPPKDINKNISDPVNQAILQGMRIYGEERPQTIQDFLNLLQPADTTHESLDSNAETASLSLPQNKETQQNNQLLIRTGVMGAGFWWLAVALLKITAGFSGVTLIVGLIFLVCSQIKINITAEERIYQFVFAFIPTMGILLGIWQAKLPILPIYSIILMPLISGFFASLFMWLLRKLTAWLN